MGLIATSCFEEQLDIYPKNSIVDQVLFETEEGAEAALIGLYDDVTPGYYMFSVFGLEWYGDLSGTAVGPGPSNSDAQSLALKTVTSSNRFAQRWYYETWPTIIYCNYFLNFIQDTPFRDPVRKNVAIGEAKFIRAMYYYRLVQHYGRVPIVYTVDAPLYPAKAETLGDNYDFIIRDLEEAINVLPVVNNGVLRAGSYEARPTKGSAQALLAKVLLTAPDPYYDLDRAISLCDEVINGPYSLMESYPDLFLIEARSDNPETIFLISLAFNNLDGSNAGELSTFSQTWYRPTPEFFQSFEPGDQRRDVNIEYNFIFNDYRVRKMRYDPRTLNGMVNNNFPQYYIRLADIIMLKAECLAYKNFNSNREEILSLLNQIRDRAFGDDQHRFTLEDIPDEEAFWDLYVWERRKEFFFECQHFFDLKRMGLAEKYLGLTEYQLVFPFGSDALALNPNLVQNTGY